MRNNSTRRSSGGGLVGEVSVAVPVAAAVVLLMLAVDVFLWAVVDVLVVQLSVPPVVAQTVGPLCGPLLMSLWSNCLCHLWWHRQLALFVAQLSVPPLGHKEAVRRQPKEWNNSTGHTTTMSTRMQI